MYRRDARIVKRCRTWANISWCEFAKVTAIVKNSSLRYLSRENINLWNEDEIFLTQGQPAANSRRQQ